MRARVLVSDAETAAAVAVVRSLGRAGHKVAVLAHSPHAAAAESRFAAARVRVPDAERRPDDWTSRLVATVRESGWDLFLPVTDTSILLADAVRDELSPRVKLAMPDSDALQTLLDKQAVLDRASEAGVPVLRRFTGEAVDKASLPAVVKPGCSRARGFTDVRSATARIVPDRRALAAEVDRLERAGLGAYVEPWVPGEGRGIFLLRSGGEVIARFAHRRIREASPLGGPSAVAESVEPDADLIRYAEALAEALDVEGPFMAEFRGRPGSWVLLEVNARFWGTLGLAVDAGVDFPALYVASLLGFPPGAPASPRTGVRRRNLSFDLRRVGRTFLGRPRGIDIPWPGRGSVLADLILRGAPGLYGRPDDPAPGRAQALHLIRKAIRRG